MFWCQLIEPFPLHFLVSFRTGKSLSNKIFIKWWHEWLVGMETGAGWQGYPSHTKHQVPLGLFLADYNLGSNFSAQLVSQELSNVGLSFPEWISENKKGRENACALSLTHFTDAEIEVTWLSQGHCGGLYYCLNYLLPPHTRITHFTHGYVIYVSTCRRGTLSFPLMWSTGQWNVNRHNLLCI